MKANIEFNPDGSIKTTADIAAEYIDYLKTTGVVSEKIAKSMSHRSMAGYTQEYFVKNMGFLAASNEMPEEKWNEVKQHLLDPKFAVLFGKKNKPEMW